jgi:hypothetical protein
MFYVPVDILCAHVEFYEKLTFLFLFAKKIKKIYPMQTLIVFSTNKFIR